jgi:HSP20 family protein
MSDIIFPRSPREQMDGWNYLPRFIDKVRLHLAGRLSEDYTPNFAHKGFDAEWLKAAGLSAETFIATVQGTLTDGQVCDWVRQNVKKSATEKTTDGWTHRESHYGSFSRAIPLPEAVDPAKVTARYDKGVLTVELQKSPTSTSRKVPVLTS